VTPREIAQPESTMETKTARHKPFTVSVFNIVPIVSTRNPFNGATVRNTYNIKPAVTYLIIFL